MSGTGARRVGAAMVLPALGWFLFEQGLIATMRAYCRTGGPPVGPIWGIASLALCAFAAWIALPVARGDAAPVLRFLARLALIGSGLFALAIGFQIAATLIVPPCVG